MSPNNNHQIHLVLSVESDLIDKIVVAEGISFLVTANGGRPQLAATPPPSEAPFVIEPVFIEHQPQMILISPPNRRARVNGTFAPRAALVREKDVIHLDDGPALHVTVYNRPRVEPVSNGLAGKDCPVCRTTLSGTVYVCPCGTSIHVRSEAKPGEQPLECIKVISECPHDGKPIVLTEGYSWVPGETGEE
jgi:hypothetical protein